MEIRILKQECLLPALHMVWDIYASDVIPNSTPEAVNSFREYIRYENIMPEVMSGRLTIFGAYDQDELCGTIGITKDGLLTLFFVQKQWQGKGIGRMLFQTAYNYCVQNLGVRQITVMAAPGTVERYRHLGMQISGPEVAENGLTYTPMETFAIPGLVQPVKKRSKTPVVIGVIAGLVLTAAIIFAGFLLISGIKDVVDTSINEEKHYEEDYDDREYDPEEDGEYDNSSEENGINAIDGYIDESKTYDFEEENYSYSGEPNSTTIIDFYTNYPSLNGLADPSVEQKVNDILKKCAMQTVDEIYTNPSQEMKERVLNAIVPALVSYVDYKICYADDRLLSIAFEDYSYKGSEEYYDLGFRTLNINLTDGTVYSADDIIEFSDEFLEVWLEKMRQEAGSDNFLEELDKESLRNILEGESQDGVYMVNFFVCSDGIEIGLELNYPDGSKYDQGYAWVTAPFSVDDLKEYKKDSSLWDIIDR